MSPETKVGRGNERPPWSVTSGEFDPTSVVINAPMVSLMAKKFWYADPTSDGRRMLQSIELVLKSFELSGLDRQAVEEKITGAAIGLRDYPKQIDILNITPELVKVEKKKEDEEKNYIDVEPSPSPVMKALRTLIEKTNEMEMIIFDDRQVDDKERWSVDERTRRLSRAIVCSLYREEYPLGSPGPVE